MLDSYKERIIQMLEKEYIGTRIYNELVEIGYRGSLSSVHRYIADIKEAEQIKAKATTRVETEPGKQMQYDWKECENLKRVLGKIMLDGTFFIWEGYILYWAGVFTIAGM